MPDETKGGDEAGFKQRLSQLKQAGASIFVTSSDVSALNTVSRQLLGNQRKDREPLFVLLGRDRAVIDDRVGEAIDVDDVPLIEYGFYRSTASTNRARSDVKSSDQLTSGDQLLTEIIEAINNIENRRENPLIQGELRICLDSVSLVIDEIGREQTEDFFSALRDVVIERAGIAHSILPMYPVPKQFDWISDCFDAIVEIRSIDGVPHERWRLDEPNYHTDWIRVRDVMDRLEDSSV